jgi:hypothetical protein
MNKNTTQFLPKQWQCIPDYAKEAITMEQNATEQPWHA